MPGATKLGYWRLGCSDTGGSDTGGLEATRLAGQGLEAWGDCWLVGVGDWLCSHTLDAQRGRRIVAIMSIRLEI